jgi:hypothetical protein
VESFGPRRDVNWAEIGIEPIDLNRDEVLVAQRRQQIADAVKTWSGQLVDYGGRNQLLYYRDLKVGTLDLADADPVAVDALMDGRTIPLSRLFGVDLLADRLKRARAIRNKSRESLEERGIVTCFLGVGMATWTNTAGTATPAAPILLREASIAAVGAGEDDFQISLTGETDINPTLLHLLEERFAVSVAADVADLIDDDRFDPQPVFSLIEKEASAVPGFFITPRRVLGTFSYAKLPMVNDLEANIEALMNHEVVAAIAGNRAPPRLGSRPWARASTSATLTVGRPLTNSSSWTPTPHRATQSTPRWLDNLSSSRGRPGRVRARPSRT